MFYTREKFWQRARFYRRVFRYIKRLLLINGQTCRRNTGYITFSITIEIMQYWPEVSTVLQERDDNQKTEDSEPSARATATRLEHNVCHIIISSYHLVRTITTHAVSPLSQPHRTCINELQALILEVPSFFTRNIWQTIYTDVSN